MAQPRRPRRPNGSAPLPVRSIRVPDNVWEPAQRRANYEGSTMSYVVQAILEGYGKGLVDLPKIVHQFKQPRKEVSP